MTGNLNFRPNGFKICNLGYTFNSPKWGSRIDFAFLCQFQ